MRVILRDTGKTVSLTKRNFVAQGGEGAVYVEGDRAIKIYEKPDATIPEGKISELAEIATDNILAPLGVVLRGDRPVGYSMRFAADCLPLPKIYPRAWRRANGLDPDAAMRMVLALRGNVAHIHGHQCLVVDLNEMNFLARGDLSTLVHIDVDSYQSPSYSPTAIMPSVRDPTTQDFTEETDWYSFAIVAFSVIVGLHPFKGRHPGYRPNQLLDRMRDGASALRDGVSLPKPCMPVDVIPPTWRTWFEGVFHSADRSMPPIAADILAIVVPAVMAAVPGALVALTHLIRTGRTVVHVLKTADGILVVLDDGTFMIGSTPISITGTAGVPAAVGVTPRMRRPVAFWPASGGWLIGYDLLSGDRLNAIRADAVTTSEDGLIHLHRGEDLLEMRYVEGTKLKAIPERIGTAAPRATHLFPGVAIQSMLGATYASLLPKAGRCVQLRLPEIEDGRLLDARFVGGRGRDGRTGVLAVAVERSGNIDVHTWSGLHAAGRFEHHAIEEDVGTPDINLVELDTGVCISVASDGTINMFKPGSDQRRAVQDDALANARLFAGGGTLLTAFDDGLYRATMK